jgi:hypothetical protein
VEAQVTALIEAARRAVPLGELFKMMRVLVPGYAQVNFSVVEGNALGRSRSAPVSLS